VPSPPVGLAPTERPLSIAALNPTTISSAILHHDTAGPDVTVRIHSLSRYSPGTSSSGTSRVRTSFSSLFPGRFPPPHYFASARVSLPRSARRRSRNRLFRYRQSLEISRLSRPNWRPSLVGMPGIHALALVTNPFFKSPSRSCSPIVVRADARFSTSAFFETSSYSLIFS